MVAGGDARPPATSEEALLEAATWQCAGQKWPPTLLLCSAAQDLAAALAAAQRLLKQDVSEALESCHSGVLAALSPEFASGGEEHGVPQSRPGRTSDAA